MKKIVIFMIFMMLAGFEGSCENAAISHDSFRMKTRGQITLRGINQPFVAKATNLLINLKTLDGPGQSGEETEYAPGGQFVTSGNEAEFLANNALVPAFWTVIAAPGQEICANSQSAQHDVIGGESYEFRCNDYVGKTLGISPSYVNLIGDDGTLAATPLEGHAEKGAGLFGTSQNVTVKYYKQEGNTETFTLVDSKSGTAQDEGRYVLFDLPEYSGNGGEVNYRVVVVEAGTLDIYLSHGDFTVVYPVVPPGGGGGGRTRG